MKPLVEDVGITLFSDSTKEIGCGVLNMKTLLDNSSAIN
jgi:hypothetical protein